MTNDVASLALVMTYLLALTNQVDFFMFSTTEFAKMMSGPQRIKEYVDFDEFEDDYDKDGDDKLQDWPKKGEINISKVNVRYREGLPLVIRSLDINIEDGQKVGIVGRTGSGKSTLILALMRILELSQKVEKSDDEEGKETGVIEIDGVDISKIGLHKLRKNITIIPQDPYLLEGTIRYNVDPLKRHTDEEIINALKTCNFFSTLSDDMIISQQKEKIEEKEPKKKGSKKTDSDPDKHETERKQLNQARNLSNKDRIEFQIEDQGANLSLGQRQLICISRALIKKPRILLMDEATANIDQKTDSVIQRVIKENLKESTVLTIAHRLVTVIQYDKLVILKDGKLVEEGTPLKLIDTKESYFRSLVEEGGDKFMQKMRFCAENKDADPTQVEF